jgi:predicted lipoprotein
MAAILAVVRPWTVRPIVGPVKTFDAAAFAGEAWPRIVDEASRNAIDLSKGLQAPPVHATAAPGRKSVFVTSTGTVAAVARTSRVGTMRITLTGGAPGAITVQIGPVIRGTALRDAVTFIRFNDFANQFEFAAVSNALHERVLRDVLGSLNVDTLVGQPVTILGAVTLPPGNLPDPLLDIVPVRIAIAGGHR